MPRLPGVIKNRIQGAVGKAQSKLEDAMMRALENEAPGQLHRAIFTLAERAHMLLALYTDRGPGLIQIWRGKEPDSGCSMQVAYLSRGKHYLRAQSIQYLQQILFADDAIQVEERFSGALKNIRRELETLAAEVDLIIFEDNALLQRQPSYGQWRKVPLGVRMIMQISAQDGWDDIERKMHSQKHNIKLAKKQGYTYECAQTRADFDFFFDRMYLPMVRERYQREDVVVQREQMYEQFCNGILMFAREPGGILAAGALFTVKNRTVIGVANGMLDGDQEWYTRGAISALYYETIRWCFDNKIKRYDAGSTRPFLTDPLLKYKKRWGFMPERDTRIDREWLIWAPDGASVAADWLETHPAVSFSEQNR
jgi:hypothetical protein